MRIHGHREHGIVIDAEDVITIACFLVGENGVELNDDNVC